MSQRRLATVLAFSTLVLTGCAMDADSPVMGDPGSLSSPSSDGKFSPPSSETGGRPIPINPDDMPPADAEGQARADAWLAGVLMPPGAVAVLEQPSDAGQLGVQHNAWWCSPMGLATGYWRVPGMGVVETTNWLGANPGPGLVSTLVNPLTEDDEVDSASLGHVPALGALEGIGFTVAPVADGAVVRAEVGAIGETTVCPTPQPGVELGGPGQG